MIHRSRARLLAGLAVPTETPSVGGTPDPSTSADREEKKAQKRAERAARNQADGETGGSSEDTVARGLGVAAPALSAVAVGLGIIVLRRPGG
jgi:hypothetical protein